MTRKRTTMAGGTDYTGFPLEDIIFHLQEWRANTESAIKRLHEMFEGTDLIYDKLADAPGVREFINYFIILFGGYLGDFDRLLTELPNGVKERHIEILVQLSNNSRSKIQHCESFKKDFLDTLFVHEDTRTPLININGTVGARLRDYDELERVALRLKTYIGD